MQLFYAKKSTSYITLKSLSKKNDCQMKVYFEATSCPEACWE